MGGRLLVAVRVPFVEKEATSDDEVPQLLKNQLVMRSAPVIGRGLTFAGVSAIAYSTTMPTTSVLPRAQLLTKKQAKAQGFTHFADEPKRKVTYRPANPFAETKWMEKTTRRKQWGPGAPERPSSPRKMKRVGVRTAGVGAVALGKALPIMAYGYVGYHLLKGDATKEDVDRLVFGGTYQEYKDMTTTIRNDLPGKAYFSGVALKTAATVAVGFFTGLVS